MRLREVHVRTRALAQVRRFYAEGLGLPGAFAAPGRFGVRVGASLLVFHEAGPGEEGVCHFAFNVPENRIEDALAWIRPRAPVLREGGEEVVDFASWDAHAVYFEDPGGHVVELIARHGLPNASEAPFGPESLLEISEVGMPVPDVAAAVAALEDALGERPWRPAGPAFAPVGDERGLLILVREGRPWFPTQARAAARVAGLRVEAARAFEGAPLGVPLRSEAFEGGDG